MTKIEEFNNPRSTLNKAFEDEPIFILRSTDITATEAVKGWISTAVILGLSPAKIQAARDLLQAMVAWQTAHPGLVKYPD